MLRGDAIGTIAWWIWAMLDGEQLVLPHTLVLPHNLFAKRDVDEA
jgi:hypothetical protein